MEKPKIDNSISCECCIMGAGPAGLAAASELIKHGVNDILIIDKNKIVGGLSRTENYDGVRFDIGGHRFFTKNSEVDNLWHETLGDDFKPVQRLSRIFYRNRFFNYPLKPWDVFIKLGPYESLSTFFSLIQLWLNKPGTVITFEDWVVQKFGRKLYETFFKTYTEKVWGIPCDQISAEWSAQRIKGLDAMELIKSMLMTGKNKHRAKTLVEQFYFPTLGAGQMYEAMCDNAIKHGAKLLLESRITRIHRQDNTIKSIDILTPNGGTVNIAAQQFFSSVPLGHLFSMLTPTDSDIINHSAGMLKYRDHITVNLLLDNDNLFPDQWLYVHSPDIQMARLANYSNFSRKMIDKTGKTALSAEYFVFKGMGLWNESDRFLIALATRELKKIGLIKNNEVEKAWVVREAEAYPINYVGLNEHYDKIKTRVGQFTNLFSIGRAGMHKYNNMDHSILSGMLAARNYLKLPGSPYNLWKINIDAEYHEGDR